MTLTPADFEVIEAAAAELDGLALDIRMSNTVGGNGGDWGFENDAKTSHDKIKALSAKLYSLHQRTKSA